MTWVSLILEINMHSLFDVHLETIHVHAPEREQLLEFLIPVKFIVVFDDFYVVIIEFVVSNLILILIRSILKQLLILFVHLAPQLFIEFATILSSFDIPFNLFSL